MNLLKSGAVLLILVAGTSPARDLAPAEGIALEVNRCAKGDIAWN